MTGQPRSGIFYHGTTTEVEIGDRVRLKPWFFGWFRKSSLGNVCYIPGISTPHRDLEYEDVKEWAILRDDGVILSSAYDPNGFFNGQISKYVEFVSRGSVEPISPEERLDDTEPEPN
ncbi:MAG TPA: hypothetical protein VGI40_28355 [Pirellulaceae bacterium]